ncbi:MAG: PTS sugar transporter subunit IIA [Bacteroidales bacterium]|nr:PTS sugar transporter subunit IIA [Bacteroidales bacterium]
MKKTNIQQKVQKFGRSLSGMIMPNIGAFIAWGLLTALFIPTGWCPNEYLGKLVDPMLKYLLPILIGYTAGKNIAGDRGGVTGAIATMGVVIGSSIPMFIGAMMMGPLGGWCIKKFDKWTEGKVKDGFEMLINNFSIGIIGLLLAIFGYMFVGDIVIWLTKTLSKLTVVLIDHHLLPLVALVVEPAKVMFLNNAINHGIFSPIGIEQANELGKSVMFLFETNPGPGLGVLLACWAFGKGATRQSAPGAIIIQSLGGIHEIYFPYILARPGLLLGAIAGSAAALGFYQLTDAGLVAPASPGNFITLPVMAPKGQTLIILGGILIAAAVSFLVSIPFMRGKEKSVEEDLHIDESRAGFINLIMFACDAGMGSSALGATRFRKRTSLAGLEVKVRNCAVDQVPDVTDLIVCQRGLAERVKDSNPDKEVVIIDNFLSDPALDRLLERLIRMEAEGSGEIAGQAGNDEEMAGNDGEMVGKDREMVGKEEEKGGKEEGLLRLENIRTGLAPESKEEAIRRAGKILHESGYVDAEYIDAMIARENLTTTYMGMGLAIPHGTSEAKAAVKKSGIVVLQYPEGVDFEGEKAHLIIGIAGVGDAHLEILAKVSEALEDEEVLERLSQNATAEEIYQTLNK